VYGDRCCSGTWVRGAAACDSGDATECTGWACTVEGQVSHLTTLCYSSRRSRWRWTSCGHHSSAVRRCASPQLDVCGYCDTRRHSLADLALHQLFLFPSFFSFALPVLQVLPHCRATDAARGRGILALLRATALKFLKRAAQGAPLLPPPNSALTPTPTPTPPICSTRVRSAA
jgi:hypothetical protein